MWHRHARVADRPAFSGRIAASSGRNEATERAVVRVAKASGASINWDAVFPDRPLPTEYDFRMA